MRLARLLISRISLVTLVLTPYTTVPIVRAQTVVATQELPTPPTASSQAISVAPPTLDPSSMEQSTETSGNSNTIQSIWGWSWSDFWVNLVSNVLATALLGLVLYFLITQPRERSRKKKRQLQLLGMLKGELAINLERVNKVIDLLEPIEDVDSKPMWEKLRTGRFSDVTKEEAKYLGSELPRKYTRGIWNALKEDGFITELDENPALIFFLLRTNEALVVADTSRRILRTELLKGNTDIDGHVNRALVDSKNLLNALSTVLPFLENLRLPTFPVGDITVEEGD